MNSQETRLYCFKRAKWRCEVCGKPFAYSNSQPQLAHRIKQSKYNLKKYGKDIMHHHFNLVAVDNLFCNSKVDLGVKQELINELVKKIILDIEKKKLAI